MKDNLHFDEFLAHYDVAVKQHAETLRDIILKTLPGCTEQLDLPAKMIAYCYGQKYAALICVLIPSKKGLKLGFNRGTQLSDPDKILEGRAKISRYVVIKSLDPIFIEKIRNLLIHAFQLYKQG